MGHLPPDRNKQSQARPFSTDILLNYHNYHDDRLNTALTMSRKADPNTADPTALAGFPLMAASEIRDCMEALGITVHPDDLTKPTPASIHAIWAALLDELMDISTEMLEEPKRAVLSGMTTSEMYTDTIGMMVFFGYW